MTEMPPILSGSSQQQIAALRDYLVRLSRSLDGMEMAAPSVSTRAVSGAAQASMGSREAKSEKELRSLIVKTADTVNHQVETLSRALREDYMAKSDFGEYSEQIDTLISATARHVVESYNFTSQIEALSAAGQEIGKHITAIRGEICRGIIEDPATGETALGIAISENLSFTGDTVTESGIEYYCLSPGQTLGIYTATGWQFWINGAKKGWFDSNDAMLHVGNIAVEENLRVSDDWLISCADGFGIRYLS